MKATRRTILRGGGMMIATSVSTSKAAGMTDWIKPSPPEPIKFPRKRLEEGFAVLLLRAAYDSVDELDFVPMDEFQKDFWLQRRGEQESYLNQYAPLRMEIGQLADPLYFDYISYSQWQTIDRLMRKGRKVFQEREGAEGELRTIVRDPRWQDNASLPAALCDMVGDKILHGLQEGFRGMEFDGPPVLGEHAKPEEVLQGVQRILDIFVGNGYALQAKVEDVTLSSEMETKFNVRVEGAANSWAIQALQSHNCQAINYYDAFTIDAYMRQTGKSAEYVLHPGSGTLREQWRFV